MGGREHGASEGNRRLPRRPSRLSRWLQGGGAPRNWVRCWLCPLLTTALIVAQQRTWYLHPERLQGAPIIRETTTIHEPFLFDYGLHYWGLVPVYSLDVLTNRYDRALYTPDAAARLLAERGHTLRMEYTNTMRIGERMVKVMKYPLMLWHGTAFGTEHRGLLGTLFTLSLAALAFALCRYGPFPLGVFLPLVISSSTFAGADLYARHLTQTVLITAACFAMALLAPLIFDRRVRTGSGLLRAAILAAIVVFLMNIRSTLSPLYAGVLLVILCYPRRRVWWRLGAFAAVLAGHVVIAKAFEVWWEARYREASAVVEQLGGQPYRGVRMVYHSVYHSMWCGLADFDTKYGYRWSDNQPESYAWPLLRARGQDIETGADTMGYVAGGAWIEYQPEYGDVLRARLLDNIRADPGWYARIILQRVQRILWENEPARLNFIVGSVAGPRSPWPYVAILVAVLALRLWNYVKLLLLAAPTLAVPLLVTTYGGQQVEFIGHLVLAAIGATMLCRLVTVPLWRAWRRRRWKGAACAG